MNWISQAWTFISFLGINKQKNYSNRTIILSNQLNATLLVIMLLLSVTMKVLRVVNDTSITIASYRLLWMMGINIIHIILSYNHRPNTAKFLLIFSAPLIFIVIPTFLGFIEDDSFFNYSDMIIALSLIPQLIIKPSGNKWLYTSSMFYYLFLLIINDDLIMFYGSDELGAKEIYSGFKVYAEITGIAIFLFINS